MIVSIVFLAVFLLALVGFGRIIWRVLHDNEEARRARIVRQLA